MKSISEWEIVDHGVDGDQYFPGIGVSHTDFDYVAIGTGYSQKNALENALEDLASQGYEIPKELEEEVASADDTDLVQEVLNRDKPDIKWKVIHHSIGMGSPLIEETFESEEDALAFVQEALGRLKADGFPITELEPGKRWEIEEPEGVAMVPDEVGTITIDEDRAAYDQWEKHSEMLILSYFVGIRVKDGAATASAKQDQSFNWREDGTNVWSCDFGSGWSGQVYQKPGRWEWMLRKDGYSRVRSSSGLLTTSDEAKRDCEKEWKARYNKNAESSISVSINEGSDLIMDMKDGTLSIPPVTATRIQPMSKYRMSKTFQVITEESAQNGDFADSGYEYENKGFDSLFDMADEMREAGATEPSDYPTVGKGTYFSSNFEMNYRTGEQKEDSFHPDGLSDEEMKKLWSLLKMNQSEFNKAREAEGKIQAAPSENEGKPWGVVRQEMGSGSQPLHSRYKHKEDAEKVAEQLNKQAKERGWNIKHSVKKIEAAFECKGSIGAALSKPPVSASASDKWQEYGEQGKEFWLKVYDGYIEGEIERLEDGMFACRLVEIEAQNNEEHDTIASDQAPTLEGAKRGCDKLYEAFEGATSSALQAGIKQTPDNWKGEGCKNYDDSMDVCLDKKDEKTAGAMDKTEKAELLEKIAAVQHDAWTSWSKSVSKEVAPERLERWQEFWVPYDQLDEGVKDLDREWAEEVMEVLAPYLGEAQQAKEMVTKVDANKYPELAQALSSTETLAALEKVLGKKVKKKKRKAKKTKASPEHKVKYPKLSRVRAEADKDLPEAEQGPINSGAPVEATGEMGQEELEPNGEWYGARLILEWACDELGLECLGVKPFDQYQGPYAKIPGGKVWLNMQGEPGEIIIERNGKFDETFVGEPDQKWLQMHDLLEGPAGNA